MKLPETQATSQASKQTDQKAAPKGKKKQLATTQPTGAAVNEATRDPGTSQASKQTDQGQGAGVKIKSEKGNLSRQLLYRYS